MQLKIDHNNNKRSFLLCVFDCARDCTTLTLPRNKKEYKQEI